MEDIHKRARKLNNFPIKDGPILYWMSRDQRLYDNWALIYASKIALKRNQPLLVCFSLVPSFPGATLRHYSFMLDGLKELEQDFINRGIPFKMLMGDPIENIPEFIKEHNIEVLVSDFDPLAIKQIWKREISSKIEIPHWEVDAHNIVPCWVASPKQEFAAYTIRSKINKLLTTFLVPYDQIEIEKSSLVFNNNWEEISNSLSVDQSIKPVDWLKPGCSGAKELLKNFINNKLSIYNDIRNDPTLDGQSNLSPYLHFGQISSQLIALEVKNSDIEQPLQEAFLEELIIRKELADNFCYYTPHYTTISACHPWAYKTLTEHENDPREYIYTRDDLENAQTHDPLWNAAQFEMVQKGKMHGYMRMYWAKKILEWTETPQKALDIAIYLNDKYQLDGRDPNGYVGCLWSIAGVHDRAWTERPVFGKIRYMNYNGCKRKFKIQEYIAKYSQPTNA